jgi:hypothetical protein
MTILTLFRAAGSLCKKKCLSFAECMNFDLERISFLQVLIISELTKGGSGREAAVGKKI